MRADARVPEPRWSRDFLAPSYRVGEARHAHALQVLTRPGSGVSAHYLLSRPAPGSLPILYTLVPESQRAWHAGRTRPGEPAGRPATSGSAFKASRKSACWPP